MCIFRVYNHYENLSSSSEKQKILDFILGLLIDWMNNMRVGVEAKLTLAFPIWAKGGCPVVDWQSGDWVVKVEGDLGKRNHQWAYNK